MLAGLVALAIIVAVVSTHRLDGAATIGADGGGSASGGAVEASAFGGAVPFAEAQDWAAATFDDYDTFVIAGTGDSELDPPTGIRNGVVTVTHADDGDDLFEVDFVDAVTGRDGGLEFLAIGDYDDTVIWGGHYELTEYAPTKVVILAEGDWSLEIVSFARVPAFTGSGTGTGAFLYTGSERDYTAAHQGTMNFYGIAHTDASAGSHGEFLFSEVEDWSGTVRLPEGPVLLLITATGDWTFTP